ncbi:MAG: hypothetical protein EA376_08745 [Phycisphaeraceae bacterium]|nr:MAG: hypothetical protein EA376_08745 [Phycisphaeraceae bacterium]
MVGDIGANSSLFPIPASDVRERPWEDAARSSSSGTIQGSASAFASFLSPTQERQTPEEAARRAAEEFVSISMVQPILSSLRETEDAAAPFAPGDAERRFRPMLDAEIARRIVQREDYALVNEVARRMLERMGGAAEAQAGQAGKELDRHA